MQYIITANNLTFRSILKYPTIQIKKDIATFIQGESGCGKSTLLKLFNLSLSPDTGEINYNDTNINDLNPVQLRREIILVSQSVFLFDDTIKNNFEKFYEFRELPSLDDDKINEFLNLCCADFSLDYDCKNMSGGERQRIFIAICLSLMPKVLMLDEPTSALDDETSDRIMKNIKEYCSSNDITLICVSHSSKIIEKYADEKITIVKENS